MPDEGISDVKAMIADVAEKLGKTADVKAAFGEPVQVEGVTIVPVASVSCKGGGGGCKGGHGEVFSSPKDAEQDGESSCKGLGGGGGINISSQPVGYIEISNGRARFVEIVDKTKLLSRAIPLAGIAAGLFGLFLLFRRK